MCTCDCSPFPHPPSFASPSFALPISLFFFLPPSLLHPPYLPPSLSRSDIDVQLVGLIKIVIDPESIMTESTAVRHLTMFGCICMQHQSIFLD